MDLEGQEILDRLQVNWLLKITKQTVAYLSDPEVREVRLLL